MKIKLNKIKKKMKKQMIKIVAVIALIATAGWNITQSEKEGVLSDLALENIEALANEEITQDCEERTNNWCYRAISTPDGNLVESHWDRINRI
ncbi:MAG: hypothetical protein E7085_00255 [Parabacteroides distasonis]|nr:hypothetical protein [Parabacteroides distasonis]